MKLLRLIFLLPLLLLSACYYKGPQCLPPLPPPLISIVSVQTDGVPVQKIELTNFSYEDELSTPEVLFNADERWGQGSSTIENGMLSCQIVCEFGFDAPEGQYTFDVSAPGFETKRVVVDAEYAESRPGPCGRVRSTKLELELTLEPLTN